MKISQIKAFRAYLSSQLHNILKYTHSHTHTHRPWFVRQTVNESQISLPFFTLFSMKNECTGFVFMLCRGLAVYLRFAFANSTVPVVKEIGEVD